MNARSHRNDGTFSFPVLFMTVAMTEEECKMRFTAVLEYKEGVKGYYLITENGKTWYRGENAKEAVKKYIKDNKIQDSHIVIVEKV